MEDQLYFDIRKLVSEVAEIDEEQIVGDAKFVADLGMDSMLSLEILAAMERKYKIKVPETKLPEMTTLNKAVAIARELLPKS